MHRTLPPSSVARAWHGLSMAEEDAMAGYCSAEASGYRVSAIDGQPDTTLPGNTFIES
ncbi:MULTISPECIES: hypothetical protein [unclassified Cupriavidus]|uniref:hypothetical protein n=1 Tax=Cupriavidus sp. H19C3 TaxID=3241603 RepID=UPI003BF91585